MQGVEVFKKFDELELQVRKNAQKEKGTRHAGRRKTVQIGKKFLDKAPLWSKSRPPSFSLPFFIFSIFFFYKILFLLIYFRLNIQFLFLRNDHNTASWNFGVGCVGDSTGYSNGIVNSLNW